MKLPGFTAEASLDRGTGHCTFGGPVLDAVVTAGHPVTPQSGGIAIYGNWCGPGHGGGPAIDAVDAVCRAHDQCYGERGYFNCRCDREGLRNMPSAIARTPSVGGKAAGAVFIAWFGSVPCTCSLRVCYRAVRWCRGWLGIPYPCGTRTSCRTITVPGGRGGLGAC